MTSAKRHATDNSLKPDNKRARTSAAGGRRTDENDRSSKTTHSIAATIDTLHHSIHTLSDSNLSPGAEPGPSSIDPNETIDASETINAKETINPNEHDVQAPGSPMESQEPELTGTIARLEPEAEQESSQPTASTQRQQSHPGVSLNTKDMAHLGPEMIKRIGAIANYANNASRTYAFDLLPADATWGKRPKFSSNTAASKILCLKDTMDACVIWFVGRVSKQWFYNHENMPQSPVNITIEPWSVGTTNKLRKKLKTLSQPPQEPLTEDLTMIRATKIMAESKGATADQFVECYDARKALKPKAQMDAFSVNDLGIRDTVVLECNICRGWNKQESKTASGKAPASWYGFLQLKAVYLIHKDISGPDDSDVKEAPQDEGLDL